MASRERVLAVLRGGIPDRIPWAESGVDRDLQIQIMGTTEFEPAEWCRKLGLDAFGGEFPKSIVPLPRHSSQSSAKFSSYYFPAGITFDFIPPWIAETETADSTGRSYVKKGLLASRQSLELFDEFLPDPDHPARYEQVAAWIEQYKQEFAVFARIRLGAAPTLESMGIDVFSYMLYDDPDLIHEIHGRFSAWSAKVVKHLNELDFDFYWVADDLAGNNGPFMSPRTFREFFLPHMKTAAQEIKKPWIFHSDGDLFPILPDLLILSMSALHPIQPSAMDIGRVKREYGQQVAIAGNTD